MKKGGFLGDFLNFHSAAKYQKIEGVALETLKTFMKKSHKAEITKKIIQKICQGPDSNPRPSASETSKNPD